MSAVNRISSLEKKPLKIGMPAIARVDSRKVQRVMGIVNGTTNYILTRMSEAGASYTEALAEAQSLGYAERDPTADVEGFDLFPDVAYYTERGLVGPFFSAKAPVKAQLAEACFDALLTSESMKEALANKKITGTFACETVKLFLQQDRGVRSERLRAKARAFLTSQELLASIL